MYSVARCLLGLMLLFVLGDRVAAQSFGTGVLFDDAAYESEWSMARGMDFTDIDTLKAISLKEYAPPAGSQGAINSCVAWSAGYAALTIYNRVAGQKIEPRSPLFLYNQLTRAGECNRPQVMNKALELLRDLGDCSYSDFSPPGCDLLPSAEIKSKATTYRIKDFYTIFSIRDIPEVKIQNTIRSLSSKKPVITAMPIFKNLETIGKDGLYIPDESSGELSGHAMCVTGFNKDKKLFQLLNSWGKDWGEEGYCYMRFEDFARYTKYGFGMVPDITRSLNFTDETVQLGGEFVFKKLFVEDGQYVFKAANTVLKNGVYYLTEPATTRDHYKLVVQNPKENTYLYVFSFKPNQTTELLFPKKIPGTELRELPVMTSGRIKVIIPEKPTSAFRPEQVGTDYLCILYCDRRIEQLDLKLRAIEKSQGTFMERLKTVFADELVPDEEIQYELNTMKAEVTEGHGRIIPIILAAEVI